MSDLDPGEMVDGRYRVLSRLGAGGMADVFLVEDTQLSRKVALKLLHRRFSADPGFVERFRREAQAAASLQHPNVVGVYDRGAWGGTYYIAMEYLPGRSLKQLIRDEAPLDPLRAIEIAIQILKAARFAHRRGVIHRDLKPHNVIIDEADQAKVTDFGIARAGASDMTETGSIMGTAQYLSPEQAQGHAVSETSDLYSVGIVLYEMLTGRVPFEAESAVTIALKHVSEAPPPPRELNPSIPQPLEQVVLWALNKNPADRPADAEQFIAVLEQVRDAIASGAPGEITASMAAVTAAAEAGHGPAPPAVTPPTAMMPAAEILSRYEVPALSLAESSGNGRGSDSREKDRKGGDGSNLVAWLLALLILLLIGGGVTAFLLTRHSKALVPVVVNEQLNVAQAQLQNAGFTVSLLPETSSEPNQTVIGQSPDGGVRRDTGSTVTLTVSSGPGNVSVPTVTSLPEKQAIKQLEQAGLKVNKVLTQSSSIVPAGQATETVPGAGTTLAQGFGVNLYISSGQAPETLADVTGDTEAAARSQLTGQGFVVTTSSQSSSTQPVGTVLSQSPAAGAKLAAGATVNIVLATAPTTAAVPSVVGDTASAASAQLKSAGFTVTMTTKRVKQQNEEGLVVSQSPTSGATASKGSAVTIVVGDYKGTTSTTTTGTTTTPTTTTTTPTTTTTSTTP